LIKVSNGTRGQKWQFNCKAEAIVTEGNQILEQQSNGSNKNMVTTPTGLNNRVNRWWAGFAYKDEQFVNLKTNTAIDATGSATEGA
jgi:hypothetical protein